MFRLATHRVLRPQFSVSTRSSFSSSLSRACKSFSAPSSRAFSSPFTVLSRCGSTSTSKPKPQSLIEPYQPASFTSLVKVETHQSTSSSQSQSFNFSAFFASLTPTLKKLALLSLFALGSSILFSLDSASIERLLREPVEGVVTSPIEIGGWRTNTTIFSLIAINVAIFALTHFGQMHAPDLFRHFVTSYRILFHEKRWYTAITSAFGHNGAMHLLVNMWVLNSFGGFVSMALGEPLFAAFYMTACIFSAVGGAILRRIFSLKTGRQFLLSVPGMGASGAICAIFAFFATLIPNAPVGIILLPFRFTAEQGLAGFCLFDLCGLIYSMFRHSPIGHATHLAGCLFGYLVAKGLLTTRQQQQRRR